MSDAAQIELLPGLPGDGPMYVPVTPRGEPHYSEGFVARIFRSDHTWWIANFKRGMGSVDAVFDHPELKRIVVIASGELYVMDPDQHQPLAVHGHCVQRVLPQKDGRLVGCTDTHVFVLGPGGEHIQWSARLSLDGFAELELKGDLLYGKAFWGAGADNNDWSIFSIDINTMVVLVGHSWPE